MVYSLHHIALKNPPQKHQKVNKTELFKIFRLYYSRQSQADPRYTNRADYNVIVITGDLSVRTIPSQDVEAHIQPISVTPD